MTNISFCNCCNVSLTKPELLRGGSIFFEDNWYCRACCIDGRVSGHFLSSPLIPIGPLGLAPEPSTPDLDDIAALKDKQALLVKEVKRLRLALQSATQKETKEVKHLRLALQSATQKETKEQVNDESQAMQHTLDTLQLELALAREEEEALLKALREACRVLATQDAPTQQDSIKMVTAIQESMIATRSELDKAHEQLAHAIEEAGLAKGNEANLRSRIGTALGDGHSGGSTSSGSFTASEGPWWRSMGAIACCLVVLFLAIWLSHMIRRDLVMEWSYYANGMPSGFTTTRPEGQRHGDLETYTENGSLVMRGQYKNGFKEGAWRYWHGTGLASTEFEYRRGLLTWFTSWRENGGKHESGPILADERHGDWRTWHENGTLAEEGPYVEGMRLGVWDVFDEDGVFLAAQSGTSAGGGLAEIEDLVEHNYQGEFLRWHSSDREPAEQGWINNVKQLLGRPDRGQQSHDGLFVGGLPVGTFSTYHPNGQAASRWQYSDGLIEGTLERWDSAGDKQSLETYASGILQGPTMSWHPHTDKEAPAEVKARGNYDQGKLHGTYEVFYAAGTPRSRMKYVAGALNGQALTWHPGGKTETRSEYKEGKLHGTHEVFYANGTPHSQMEYRSGVLNGSASTWHANGQVESQGKYRNGQQQGAWETNHVDGRRSSKGSYEDGAKRGPWTMYHPTGELMAEGAFHYGKQHEAWSTYDEAGILSSQGDYWDGHRQGPWSFYLSNRSLDDARSGYYHRGQLLPYPVPRRAWYPNDQNRFSGHSRGGEIYETWLTWPSDTDTTLENVWTYWEGGRATGVDMLRLVVFTGDVSINWGATPNQKRSEGKMRLGSEEGDWEYFYRDGQASSRGLYERGMKTGVWTSWHANGKSASSLAYESGFLAGPASTWFQHGVRESTGAYEVGRRTADWQFWHGTGDIKATGQYSKGKRTGSWKFHNEEGKKVLEGAYDNGKRSGTWKLYHRESGQGEHENALANISSQGSYDKGKRHGKFQGYYANGRLRFTVHFFSDTPDGEWQFFSQNGEPQLSGTFSTGTPVGPWRTWWEGGKRRYEGDYLRSEFGLEPITLVDEHLLPLEEWREVPAPQEPIIE